MTLPFTPATLALLADVNAAWGGAWALALARHMRDGVIVELDGEACLVEANVQNVQNVQNRHLQEAML